MQDDSSFILCHEVLAPCDSYHEYLLRTKEFYVLIEEFSFSSYLLIAISIID